MTETQKLFFELGRDYINRKKTVLDGRTPDWQALYALAAEQMMHGILYMQIKRSDLANIVPTELFQRLEQNYRLTVAKMVTQQYEFKRLGQALDTAKIVYLPWKGYALRPLFPDPELRTMGDVDFLIKKEDQKRAEALFREAGYTLVMQESHVRSYDNGHLHIEAHIAIPYTQPETFKNAFMQDPWAFAEDRNGALTFNDSYQLVCVTVHLLRHMIIQGCGMRQMLDVCVLLQQKALDWSLITEQLEQTGYLHAAQVLYTYCVQQMQIEAELPFEMQVEQAVFDRITEDILSAGVFGFENVVELTGLFDENADATDQKHFFLRMLFPPKARLLNMYTYAERHPILIPVAYMHRLARHIFVPKRRRRTQTIVKQRKQISAAADKKQQLYRDLME